MKTRDRLLMAGGGGVMPDWKKADREDDCSICIGLGGTGADGVRTLKKEVYRHLKPDDPESTVPSYSNIRFLILDCDGGSCRDYNRDITDIDMKAEYFDLSCPDVKALLSQESVTSRWELSWLNHESILVPEGIQGTGGIRQVGRLLLFQKIDLLEKKLTDLITEASCGVPGDLNIHIFSGVSGGTGGGIFPDVCYILRHVLEKLGRESALINSYLFLPDVNLSVPALRQNPMAGELIRQRGFAALKELDYLLNLEEAQDRFIQDYGGFQVDTQREPVDSCYLISATDDDGTLIEDGYQYAIHTAIGHLFPFLTKTFPPPEPGYHSPGCRVLPMAYYLRKFSTYREAVIKKHGETIRYSVTGSAWADLPLCDVNENFPERLIRHAKPAFWKSPCFDLSMTAKTQNIWFPWDSRETFGNYQMRECGYCVLYWDMKNRISMTTDYHHLPLYAFQEMEELELAYERGIRRGGLHLYEAGDVDWREYLPSPCPHSLRTKERQIPRIEERDKKLMEELEEARKARIVYSDMIGWHVKLTKTGNVSELMEAAESYVVHGEPDYVKLMDMLDSLKTAREQMFYDSNTERMPLSTKGAGYGSEETVLLDNYLRYPAVERAVREQLYKVRALEQEIARLESIAEEISGECQVRELFFNGIFTGIIHHAQESITFPRSHSGLEEDLVLSDETMAYGGKAPLYQAFLTYQNLGEDIGKILQDKVCEAIDGMTDEIYEVSRQIRSLYCAHENHCLKTALSLTAADPKREEIRKFYREFMNMLQDYIVTYM